MRWFAIVVTKTIEVLSLINRRLEHQSFSINLSNSVAEKYVEKGLRSVYNSVPSALNKLVQQVNRCRR